jgi:TrmH family RNA methyltransferase
MVLPTGVHTKSERLDSRENRWLKRFRAALQERPEDPASPIGVEGPRMVEDALRSGLEIEALLVADSGERHLARLKALLPSGLRVLRTTDRLFASVAGTETPQGIAVLVEPRSWRVEDMIGAAPLVVVLAGVQDPGNVGTIVRSAEAFGASGVIACRGSAHPLAPKAVRASAGSVLRLPTLAEASPKDILAELRRLGLRQYAATLADGETPQDTDIRGPSALWIGSEGAGLPPEIQRGADARIRIPIGASVQSLNAASASAVLLYEAARQRGDAGQQSESLRDRESKRPLPASGSSR